jgi:hypothetical protein
LGKESIYNGFNELTEDRNKFIVNKMSLLGIEAARLSVRNATKEESGDILTSRYNVKITSIED